MSVVLDFVTRTQKALAALLGALTSVAAANLLPSPYAGWVSAAAAIVTGLVTYVLPYVADTLTSLDDKPATPEPVTEQGTEVANAAPEPAAPVVDSSTPTEDTPEVDAGPDTARMSVTDLLDAMSADTP